MIVTCPTCQNKYFVQTEAIGDSKLVRCAVCGTTWHQVAIDARAESRRHVKELIKWTFFWFFVFVFLFSLFFAKSAMIKLWPPVVELYNVLNINPINQKKTFLIQNISDFFVHRDGKLYIGLRGELINISNEVQVIPSLTVSLRDDNVDAEEKRRAAYKKIWTHDMMYKKLLPNQKIIFETELQSVPYNNLICDIKLDIL